MAVTYSPSGSPADVFSTTPSYLFRPVVLKNLSLATTAISTSVISDPNRVTSSNGATVPQVFSTADDLTVSNPQQQRQRLGADHPGPLRRQPADHRALPEPQHHRAAGDYAVWTSGDFLGKIPLAGDRAAPDQRQQPRSGRAADQFVYRTRRAISALKTKTLRQAHRGCRPLTADGRRGPSRWWRWWWPSASFPSACSRSSRLSRWV
ncbi:MAG: hypothetical protein WDO13_19155 [Verrucomicrobiota bacterium]